MEVKVVDLGPRDPLSANRYLSARLFDDKVSARTNSGSPKIVKSALGKTTMPMDGDKRSGVSIFEDDESQGVFSCHRNRESPQLNQGRCKHNLMINAWKLSARGISSHSVTRLGC